MGAELWKALEIRRLQQPRLNGVNAAYYAGALVVIGAMGLFATRVFSELDGKGLALLAAAYATVFWIAARRLTSIHLLLVPGGLLATMAICMTPLMVYGIEQETGLWPGVPPGSYSGFHAYVRGGWFAMELATMAAGCVALRFIRFPFMTMPIAFVAWYMSMDLAPLMFGPRDTREQGKLVSVVVGLVMLVAAFAVDRRTREDYAFWGYLFGLLAFWGGLTLMDSGSELNKFLYCLVNVGLMFVSVLLARRVFLVFGCLGVTGYLGHLASQVFKESMLFPIVLSGLGILIIVAGLKYNQRRERIHAAVMSIVPRRWQRLLPTQRANRR